MSRELKFRAWNCRACRYWYFGLRDISKDDDGVVIIHTGNPGCVLEAEDPVEQYTELHDAEGREIYEGDIVEGVGGRGAIFKRLGCWYISGMCELGYYESRLKVIGNIHETPELLEAKR